MESNDVLDKLPRHLLSLVIEQPYNEYTAQDQAVWRYVMRQNVRYLPHVAHSSYLNGLRQTGISIDQIPHMYGMNRILKEIGWAAVAVDGFIPPAAFMEFQAYNVLVIAADIRPIDQIHYTPAPDIIHEAAGHAPIIADPEYASYLRDFGKLGSRAFSSRHDNDIYSAIRHLSILKADPYTTDDQIEEAEADLDRIMKISAGPSEMALLRNLHWWTVEYGLIGELNNPKIYGAGLLSSIGESYNCLQDHVRKIPYSLEAQHVNFDITTQQPQLFVTPDFEHLTTVLEEFAKGMALKKGGLTGILKAIDSLTISTSVLSSGIQVSGLLKHAIVSNQQPAYLSYAGPVQLAFADEQIEGHDTSYHKDGFGTPVGFLKGIAAPLELIPKSDLQNYGISENQHCRLEFESGVIVEGYLTSVLTRNSKNVILSFKDCTVTYEDKVLFQPSWGMYDMAVGAGIRSCYSGAADPDAFGFSFPVPEEKTHKIQHTEKDKELYQYYEQVREIRDAQDGYDRLSPIFEYVKTHHPEDWLLPLEIHEILENHNGYPELSEDVLRYLKKKSIGDEVLLKLIQDGLAMVKTTVAG